MTNIVDFRTGRPRPRRSILVPQDGARILLFTGVRYAREPEDNAPPFVPEATAFCQAAPKVPQTSSEIAFDLAGY